MSKIFTTHIANFFIAILLIFFNYISKAQTPIPDATPVIENFNSMSTSTTNALPATWRFHRSGTPSYSSGTRNLGVQASSGSPTGGNSYNWGSSSTERAPGVMTSGSYASPSSIMGYFRNTNAASLVSLSISYDVERYRRNSAAASVQFFYSTNGSTWTALTAGDVATTDLPTGTDTYGFSPPQLVFNKPAFTLTFPTPIASNDTFYLRWQLSTTGSNSQGIAIDNVSLTATFGTACTPPSTQASDITFSNITGTSMRVNWTNGDGDNRIVVMKEASAISGTPTNGKRYIPNTSFGSGETIATNEYVVYSGNSNFVDVTNLKCGTRYYVKVFEYNNTDSCYLKTSPPTANDTTRTARIIYSGSPTLSFSYAQGSGPSTSQAVQYRAEFLSPSSGNIQVSGVSTTHFEVSLDNVNFTNSVSIAYTGSTLLDTTVYVRLKSGLSLGTYTTNLRATYVNNPVSCAASALTPLSGTVTASPCQELYISEYFEGSLGNDKAIEIYNPTPNPISLTGYNIKTYYNGSATATGTDIINLAGTIPAYGTWVLANSAANATILSIADQTSGSLNFNGDDAIVLEFGTTRLDIFGRIGTDPGSAWTSGSYSTQDVTLVRKPNIQLGVSTNPSSSFPTLSTEWIQYLAQEDDYLGDHASTCNNTSVIVTDVISQTSYCITPTQGAAVSVSFNTFGAFNTGNIFTAQLSNASGSFASPVIIGTLTLSGTDVSGTINATIPAGTTIGTGYKIRVVATLPSGILNYYASPVNITVNLGPVNPTAVSATSSGSGNIQLNWTNPVCFDEMLVLMCSGGSITTVPIGDGSNYNVVGTSSCLSSSCEDVVYKGTGNSITINGLEDGITYQLKVWTRIGTSWSSGVASNFTPNGATTIQAGDFAMIAYNSNNDVCGSGTGDDEWYFVCFKDITNGTVIDITDNGWNSCNANYWNNTEGFYRVTYSGSTIRAGKIIKWTLPANLPVTTLGSGWAVSSLGSSVVNTNSASSGNGDQFFFLQGGNWNNGTAGQFDATYTGGRYLFAFSSSSAWGACPTCPSIANCTGSTTTPENNRRTYSDLPTQLLCYEQQPATGANDFFMYNGPTTIVTKAEWLERFLNTSNWSSYASCTALNTAYATKFPADSIRISSAAPLVEWTGAVNTNWFDCGNWSSNLVPNANVNVTIPFTTNRPVIDATAPFSDQYQDIASCKNLTLESFSSVTVEGNPANRLDIYGNLTIKVASVLDADDGNNTTPDGTIRLAGNWLNEDGVGGFAQGNSKVKFFGANTQTINVINGIEAFNDIVIEKQKQTYVELIGGLISTSITGVLEFSCGGIIKTNFHKISVLNPARTTAIIGYDAPNGTGIYSNDKYVFGNLDREINTTGIYDFPVGDIHTGEAYNPIRLDIKSGTGRASARFIAGNPGSINVPITNVTCGGATKFIHYTGMTGQGWWNMYSPASAIFGYDVYLHPNVLNVNTFPNNTIGGYKNNYRALKSTTGTAGGTWPSATAFDGDECIVSDNYYEIIGVGYSGFSDFAPGGGDGRTTALPVELISFTSTCIDNEEVQLTWITASEVNSDYFVIEKSTDAVNFVPLSTIAAQGFSTTNQIYNYSDLSNTTKVYYRLKQYDIDGKEHIFNTIYVDCSDDKSSINMYYAGNNTIKIDAQNKEGEYKFNLFQYDGKNIFSKQLNIETGKQIISIIPSQQLARGVYIIQLVNDKFVLAKKIHIE